MIHSFGIDVLTKDAKKLMRILEKLKTTVDVEYGGAYREDPTYSQILINTNLTEAQLEDWLYNSKHGYIGVFTRCTI